MISKKDFTQLNSIKDETCVSIYIPTEITGDYEKNRIRWKNAISEAENRLEEENDLNPQEIKALLAPARELLNDADFWAHQSRGLAGFYSESFKKYFHLASVDEELVSVHSDFYLFPLLREVANEDRIFILALSKNETRFFEAVNDGIYPVRIHDVVVKNMDEALNLDEEKVSLQHHTATASGDANFHANGPGTDMSDIRTRQYLRRVDDGLLEIIHDERVPLVLASVEEYHSIYKEVSKYNYVSDHMIAGNPERLSPTDLRQNVEPLFDEMRQKRIREFEENFAIKKTENQVSNNLDDIEQDAKYKNVDTLLVCQSYIDQLDNEDQERFDDIAMSVYENGGRILLVQEGDAECKTICAINRFHMETSADQA